MCICNIATKHKYEYIALKNLFGVGYHDRQVVNYSWGGLFIFCLLDTSNWNLQNDCN